MTKAGGDRTKRRIAGGIMGATLAAGIACFALWLALRPTSGTTSPQEPLAEPEAAEPVEPQEVSQPEVAEPEATQEVSQPETYTFTWTDEPQGRGGPREEHTLTYTDNGDSYTIEYDGYTLTVTEEELEWLLGEGWDEQVYDTDWSYGQDTSWGYGDGFGVGPGGRW